MNPLFLKHRLLLCIAVVCFKISVYGQMVIGSSTPSPSAILDLQSTSKGLLPPRMTTAQRDAIANPAFGLLIINTTRQCVEINLGSTSVPNWNCLTTAVQSLLNVTTSDTLYWNRKLNTTDTVSLSQRINSRLPISDTSAMLSTYFKRNDTTLLNLEARFASKLNPADTLSLSGRIDAKIGLPSTGNSIGNIMYWDGTAWVRVAAGQNGQMLQLQNGVPAWSGVAFATLTTDAVGSITNSSAAVGGAISSDGGGNISSRGIAYGTSPAPTLAHSSLTLGTGTGAFSGSLTGLAASTTYYARAYATNSAGTAYGNEQTFATLPPGLPTLTTNSISSITHSGAVTGGNINSGGGVAVTQRGVVYGTSPNPTLSNSFTQDGSGAGSFSTTLSGLVPSTTYYVRAYATNSVGTAYGSEVSFVTSSNSYLPQMISIPAGSFSMGCTTGDTNCENDEFPVHSVTLSLFQIGETEVTQQLWEYMMGTNPSVFNNPACPLCPVENVSWWDVTVFCNRLSESQGFTPCYYADAGFTQVFGKSGGIWTLPNSGNVYWNPSANGYRMPTEAEWEYAARGGSAANIYSGSNTIGDVAWYSGNSGNRTNTVKSLQSNGFSLYDMSGNVWEWCWDWTDTYPSSFQTDPRGPASGSERIIRGGPWGNVPLILRISNRDSFVAGTRYNFIGFRLARTP